MRKETTTTMKQISQILVLIAVLPALVVAFFSPIGDIGWKQQERLASSLFMDRRMFVSATVGAIVATTTAAPLSASAAAPNGFSENVEVFQPGSKLSVDDAKKRFLVAQRDANYLLEHYSEIAKGGGDAVRNYLGTQGVKSGMYGITKVLKLLQEEADDIVEYTETMQEFNAYLYQAEGAAYQAMFADGSSSRSTSTELLATAKNDLVQMCKYMDQLASLLNL
jgi:hypothetical protein